MDEPVIGQRGDIPSLEVAPPNPQGVDVAERVILEMAGFLSTIDFIPAQMHPDSMIPVAQQVYKKWIG